MTDRILLCSDLDRTLLPNGRQPESAGARRLLRALARHPEISLAYVSGRDLTLLREAVDDYALPVPDYAIGDVGVSLYRVSEGGWQSVADWQRAIAPDWHGHSHAGLAAALADLPELRLQEAAKQQRYKISYYAEPLDDAEPLLNKVRERLAALRVRAGLVWSVDEVEGVGLLDLLPAAANKLHAIRFLMDRAGFSPANTVFAGDSGNDLPVLASEIDAVLVANATAVVREQARREAERAGHADRLYLAAGGFLGMNGNYSAGVLEGLVHFQPRVLDWLRAALD